MRPAPCVFMNPHKRTHRNRPWSHIHVLPHPNVVIPEPVPTAVHSLAIALLVMLTEVTLFHHALQNALAQALIRRHKTLRVAKHLTQYISHTT